MSTEITGLLSGTDTIESEPLGLDRALVEQLEPHARKIELLQNTAILQIASEAAKIHEALRYCRGEGGYTGYMRNRLGISSSNAYRLLDVHTVFGDGESFPGWETLPRTALYQLSERSTPEQARTEIRERLTTGEEVTCPLVAEIIAAAKNTITSAASRPTETAEVELPAGEKVTTETVIKAVTGRRKSSTPNNTQPTPTQSDGAEARKAAYAKAEAEADDDDDDAEPVQEWHTPAKYLDLARRVLGAIDLDPASNEDAQHTVQATEYFTKNDDGLTKEWHGRVWLNPPYARKNIAKFVKKLIEERKAGHVIAAILLTHACPDTAWFRDAAAVADVVCFTTGRVRFENADGRLANPKQGQAFFYFGEFPSTFIAEFTSVGFVPSTLAKFTVEDVIAAFGDQLRAALPAKPFAKLCEMDPGDIASRIFETVGAAKSRTIITKLQAFLAVDRSSNPGKSEKFKTEHGVQTGIGEHGSIYTLQGRGGRSRAH
jgi:phage N-6-adenine-methyltransferase